MLRLMSYNICRGGVAREAAIASIIRASEPDLVILQEATQPHVVANLSAATGLTTWAAHRGRSLAVLSKYALAEHHWHRSFWSRHAFLELTVAGFDLRVVGVHLSALHAEWTEERRRLELRAMLGAIRARAHGFHVVTGDFNTLAPGEPFDLHKLPRRLRPFVWMSGGNIRWRTIDSIVKAGYVDGWRHRHPAVPSMPTFPTWDPHLRLDYVFVPAMFADRLTSCEVVREPSEVTTASDHFPVLATLDVSHPPARRAADASEATDGSPDASGET